MNMIGNTTKPCIKHLSNIPHIIIKRPQCAKKSVTFSPHVTLRHCHSEVAATDSQWQTPQEIMKGKTRSRKLAKLHQIIRTHSNTNDDPSSDPSEILIKVGTHATNCQLVPISPKTKSSCIFSSIGRYEILGESLRGLESSSDSILGRKRMRDKLEAVLVVEEEQWKQWKQWSWMEEVEGLKGLEELGGLERLKEVSKLSLGERTSIQLNPLLDEQTTLQKMKRLHSLRSQGASRIARAYAKKTKEAMEFSKSLAEEDARIAAEILAEDLGGAPFVPFVCPLVLPVLPVLPVSSPVTVVNAMEMMEQVQTSCVTKCR